MESVQFRKSGFHRLPASLCMLAGECSFSPLHACWGVQLLCLACSLGSAASPLACLLGSAASQIFDMLAITTGEKVFHILCCHFPNPIPSSFLCSQVVYDGRASFGQLKGFARQFFLCCCRTGDFQIYSLLEVPTGPQWGPAVSITFTFPLN